ncbi:hypothetical protein [Streptomyces sp. NPDC052179]|uniref:hypothetical protein n=1 Tax=Streptomyces sp. NPDC052179 TaxID=3155680 RepID=UPI00344AD078
MTDTPARTYAERLGDSTPQSAAALAFGNLVADVDSRQAAIQVRTFDNTEAVRQAIDHDELTDGSVFVVVAEKVVGFVVVAFGAVLTEERGPFLHLTKPGREYADGEYVDSVVVAEGEARDRGFLLRDEDAQDRIRSMRQLANISAERVRTDPNADDPEWQMALHRLTVALSYLTAHDPMTAEAVDADARRIAEDLKRIDEEYGVTRA